MQGYNLNSKIIPLIKESIRDLGVMIEPNLSGKSHVQTVNKKDFAVIGCIFRSFVCGEIEFLL